MSEKRKSFSRNLCAFVTSLGKTQREIASLLGISRSYVSRIEKKALKKLKKELTFK